MRVVIDTNILLVSISKHSEFRWVFDGFLNEAFTLCVTTEIMAEYEEILERIMGILWLRPSYKLLKMRPMLFSLPLITLGI